MGIGRELQAEETACAKVPGPGSFGSQVNLHIISTIVTGLELEVSWFRKDKGPAQGYYAVLSPVGFHPAS